MAEPPNPLTLDPESNKGNTEAADSRNGKGGKEESGTKDDAAKPSLQGPFTTSKDLFDPNFTANVISAMGPNTSPRVRRIMTSLIQHLHDFARDVELTVPEWSAGVDFLNDSGKFSSNTRNETQLVCDILGLESLVDAITFAAQTNATSTSHDPTSSAILGPFWRPDAPILPMYASIVTALPPSCGDAADHTLLFGRVLSATTGLPVAEAELDIWHTAPNGLYEQQDDEQSDMNLRGRFRTGPDGKYAIYCLRPTSYPIPYDGPAGTLLKMLDRHPMRPAHIHFIVTAPAHKPLTTQIFDRRDEHIADDAVFAVKESLICDFLPREGDPKAQFELEYDFKLVEEDAA